MGEVSKIDFNKGRIYCIRNSITDDIYVGNMPTIKQKNAKA